MQLYGPESGIVATLQYMMVLYEQMFHATVIAYE